MSVLSIKPHDPGATGGGMARALEAAERTKDTANNLEGLQSIITGIGKFEIAREEGKPIKAIA